MIRKVFVAVFFMACVVLMSQGSIVMAQNGTSPVKFWSKADILKGLDKGTAPTAGIVGGQAVQIVPDLLIRRRVQGPNNASTHSAATDGRDVTEVMVITDGSGTSMTGGTYVDKGKDYKSTNRNKGITGGETHDVKIGDVVVIAAGTPHGFTKINKEVTMIEARFPSGTPENFITFDQVKEGLAKVKWGIGGQTFPIIAATPPTMANSIIFRHREQDRPQDASVHSTGTDKVNATEVVVVLTGGGTFITGGTYVDDNPEYTKKDRAKGITGGVTRQVKAGDVIVIPPGTSHWFSKVDGQVTMIEARFPGDVTKGNK